MAPHNKIQAEALEPVRKETGTAYPATRADIDFHREFRFLERNDGPFIDSSQATDTLIAHNSPERRLSAKEDAAVERLYDLVLDVAKGGHWGPDIAIKCFADLDLVFFGGKLRNNVVVKWASCSRSKRWRITGAAKCFGLTEYPHLREKGQTRIVLNTDSILNEGRSLYSFEMLFSTLLHEMCHAYDHVVCPRNWLLMGWQNPHGEHFCARITAVHKHAMRILGLQAISWWEKYYRHHHFTKQEGAGFLSCGRHHVACDGGINGTRGEPVEDYDVAGEGHVDGIWSGSDTDGTEDDGESLSSSGGHDSGHEYYDDGFRSWNSAHISSMRGEPDRGHDIAFEDYGDDTRSFRDSLIESMEGVSDDAEEEDAEEEDAEEDDEEEEVGREEDEDEDEGDLESEEEEEDDESPSWGGHDTPWQGHDDGANNQSDARSNSRRGKRGDSKEKKCAMM